MSDALEPGAQPDPARVLPGAEAPIADEISLDADHIIGMGFDKPSRAEEVLLNLAHLAKEGEITLTDAVVVVKGDDERVHIRQTVDISPKRGAMSGALWGLLIGSFFVPPVGLLLGAGAGAASGGLAGKLVDLGLDDNWIKEVGQWIDPGTSALLLLVSHEVRPVVLRELSRFEGKVLYCTFPAAVRDELELALGRSTGARADKGSQPEVVFDGPIG